MPPDRTPAAERRRATWYCYLLAGCFTYFLNIQGNLLPFLRAELGLNWREAALHPSALAAGMIAAGLLTDRAIRGLGRRAAFALAAAGAAAGAVLLTLAGGPAASLAGCALIGLAGGMIPGGIAAFLAELHGPARNQAFAECGAVTYACAIAANLATGGAAALGLGWRAAVALGVAFAVVVVATLGRRRLADPPPPPIRGAATLPAAYWAYWATLGLGVALEYAVLFWSPAFLEGAVGLSRPAAGAAAAAFGAAMLTGRAAGSRLLRRIPATSLYPAALILVLPGFALYWGLASPALAVAGLFVIGLGVSLLYPLSLGLALGAAGRNAEAGGARTSLAAGLAILLAPLALGGLADAVGLAAAHLVIPAAAVAAGATFTLARGLERRAVRVA